MKLPALLLLTATSFAEPVTVSWEPVENVDGYRVAWGNAEWNWTTRRDTEATFTTVNLETGRHYSFSVMSRKGDYYSQPAIFNFTFLIADTYFDEDAGRTVYHSAPHICTGTRRTYGVNLR